MAFSVVVYSFDVELDCHVTQVNQATETLYLTYAIGADAQSILVACSDSKMTIEVISQPSGGLQMPDFISFDDSVQAEAWLEIFVDNYTDIGKYRFDVREVNQETKQVRVTEITLDIF